MKKLLAFLGVVSLTATTGISAVACSTPKHETGPTPGPSPDTDTNTDPKPQPKPQPKPIVLPNIREIIGDEPLGMVENQSSQQPSSKELRTALKRKYPALKTENIKIYDISTNSAKVKGDQINYSGELEIKFDLRLKNIYAAKNGIKFITTVNQATGEYYF